MSITFQCEHCGKSYVVADNLAGKAGTCKQCGKRMQVPDPSAPFSEEGPGLDPYGLAERPTPSKVTRDEDGTEPEDAPPLPRAGVGVPARSKKADGGKAKSGGFDPSGIEKVCGIMLVIGLVNFARGGPNTPAQLGFRIGVVGLAILGLVVARAMKGPRRETGAAWTKSWIVGFVIAFVFGAFVRPMLRGHRAPAPDRGGAAAPAEPSGPIALPPFPEVAPGEPVDGSPKAILHKIALTPAPGAVPAPPGHSGQLWLYLPEGEHAPASLPCILIAGAGSDLVSGMTLGEGDMAEHIPYVNAGFAVLGYEIDGKLDNPEDGKARERAAQAFLAARAGLVNAHIALEYLLAKVPQVDPKRIHAVGHSSAGTLALLLAENEPRLAGCVAFAPCVDVSAHLGFVLRNVVGLLPNGSALYTTYSPKENEDELSCPLFLFHAEDDSVVSVKESRDLAGRLKELDLPVTLEVVPTGGHYNSMIQQGIPRAIAWLKGLPAASATAGPAAGPEAR